jgi:nitrogenase subunit NifH
MDSTQIEEILNDILGDVFCGVFASDMIPQMSKYPAAIVCNTDPHDKPGQHWIAMYIDEKG